MMGIVAGESKGRKAIVVIHRLRQLQGEIGWAELSFLL
jgi:hypothetical protein